MIIQHILNNKNLRNGTLFALSSFLNTGINFIIMMVMARFITPDSYGQLGLFTTMVSLLSIFVCLNTNGFIGVNFFSSSKSTIQRLLNVVLLTTLFVYMAMLTVICFFRTTCEQISGLTIVYQFYAVSFCLLNVVNALLLDIWRLEEKVWRYGSFSVLSAICNLVLTILFVGFLKWDWQGRVYAQILTCVFFAILAVYILIRKKYIYGVIPKKKDFVDAYRFGVPLIPHSTSFWLRQGLDRYVINTFTTQTMVGFFSFAANIANIIMIVGSAFNSSHSVTVYKALAELTSIKLERLNRDCYLLLLFYISLTLCVFIGAYLFIPLVFPEYTDAIIYIFPLCIGAMFQCFYLVYVNILFFFKKTKQLMYITFSLSLLHVLLSFFLTKYGVIYTACIFMTINFFIAIFVYRYSRCILKRKVVNSVA